MAVADAPTDAAATMTRWDEPTGRAGGAAGASARARRRAGPAEPARGGAAAGPIVVAADRDPAAPGFARADRRAIVSIEDEAGDRAPRPRRGRGRAVAPGTDHAVALAARIAAAARAAAPARPRGGAARRVEATPARAARRGGRAAAALAPLPHARRGRRRRRGARLSLRDRGARPRRRARRRPRADRASVGRRRSGGRAESRNDYCPRRGARRRPARHRHRLPARRTPGAADADRPRTGAAARLRRPPRPLLARGARPRRGGRRRPARCCGRRRARCRRRPVSAQVLLAPQAGRCSRSSPPAPAEGTTRSSAGQSTGVDLDELAIAVALGEPVAEERLRPLELVGGACVRFLVAPPGELVEARGVDAAREAPGVRAVMSTARRATASRAAPCLRPRRRRARDRRHPGRGGGRGGRGRGARPLRRHGARRGARVTQARLLRAGLTLFVTGLCTAYILWKIDLRRTGHVLGHASPGWWLASCAIMAGSVWPLAWRWRGSSPRAASTSRLGWLVRTSFVAYAAGQVLPTSLGGDASRIYETARRHPGSGPPPPARSCSSARSAARRLSCSPPRVRARRRPLLDRRLRLARARARRRHRARRVRALLDPPAPAAAADAPAAPRRPARAAAARGLPGAPLLPHDAPLLGSLFGLTLVVQAARVLAIWCAGRAVGVDLSPRPYYVMGPLLFLVMLVPFTVNGLAVRESFFVSFLGALGVSADSRLLDRLPLLRRHDRRLAPGRGDHRVGGPARPGRAGGVGMRLAPRAARALVRRAAPRCRAAAARRHGFGLWLRLAAATLVLLLPGRLLARALGMRGASAALAWSTALVGGALAVTFAVRASLDLTLALVLASGAVALVRAVLADGRPARARRSRPLARSRSPGSPSAARSGSSTARSTATRSSTSAASGSSSTCRRSRCTHSTSSATAASTPATRSRSGMRGSGSSRAIAGVDPTAVVVHESSMLVPSRSCSPSRWASPSSARRGSRSRPCSRR